MGHLRHNNEICKESHLGFHLGCDLFLDLARLLLGLVRLERRLAPLLQGSGGIEEVAWALMREEHTRQACLSKIECDKIASSVRERQEDLKSCVFRMRVRQRTS